MKKLICRNFEELDFNANEAYKVLRANITFCGDNIRTIAFTSTLPNEGKSVVSFRVAKAFAETGKKVLYLDADIRKSGFLKNYGINEQIIGLSEYLAGDSEIVDIIFESNFEGLHVICAGEKTQVSAELLSNTMFSILIKTLRKAYDYVIIDCPALGSIIDAAVIAKECDGVAIVIESDRVSYKLVQNLKTQLERSGTSILGCIINKVHRRNRRQIKNRKYYLEKC